jgi:hypothetical protein
MHMGTTASIFALRSSAWVSLHHLLCRAAGISARAGRRPPTASGTPPATPPGTGWELALDFYRRELAQRELFDPAMKRIKDQLAALDDDGDARDAGLEVPLGDLLSAAATEYRATTWPEHDAANRRWIAAMAPLVERLGPCVIPRLAAAFQTRAPEAGLCVDVTPYAGWAGAYTTYNPPFPNHITVDSTRDANQGWLGVEILFHEAAHTIVSPIEGPLVEGIDRARVGRSEPGPHDLWHIVLFYTVGEIVRQALREDGVDGFVPYADAHGLYDRVPPWRPVRPALERHWQRYLDGAIGYDEALAGVVAALQP